MEHSKRLMDLNHDEAARRLADLDYVELSLLLDHVSRCLARDAFSDASAGRPRLSDGLEDASRLMFDAAKIFLRLASLKPKGAPMIVAEFPEPCPFCYGKCVADVSATGAPVWTCTVCQRFRVREP